MRRITYAALVALLACAGGALAYNANTLSGSTLASPGTQKRPFATPRPAASSASPALRTRAPVTTATRTGPGQAGYVHYFLITHPDGELESQVGVELPGERIAWSFPELGVVVSEFVKSGSISANGKTFEVEHLYGIRPFLDDDSMRELQRELPARVARWADKRTPYCEEDDPWHAGCLSCLGFVLRVLYPGAAPEQFDLPPDFKAARRNAYTTENFLLYLAGVRRDVSRAAKVKRIQALAVPPEMREELMRLAGARATRSAASSRSRARRAAAAKAGPAAPSVVQLPKRVVPRRRS